MSVSFFLLAPSFCQTPVWYAWRCVVPVLANVFIFLYSRKRKSGNYEWEDVEAASDLSEKDRMLREKEAEVLNWVEIISFYSLPRKRIIIPHKTVIKSVHNWNCNCFYSLRTGLLRSSGGDPNYIHMNLKIQIPTQSC